MSILDLPPQYDLKKFPFMRPQGPHMPITAASVCIPPALWIRDSEGALWTLGFDYDESEWRGGKWEYDVIRNGRKTGEFCRKIECKINSYGNKVVKIWGADGWREWRDGRFV
jgi:hypothetical protein